MTKRFETCDYFKKVRNPMQHEKLSGRMKIHEVVPESQ